MNFRSVLILFTILSVVCCRSENNRISEDQIRETEEALVGANRMMIQNDKSKIQEYININRLNLRESESGLWYGITKAGSGQQVVENALVSMEYTVSLLDGTLCYSSDSLGIKHFRAGKGGVESGLEEGVLMLNDGSEAIFIMPPHLAHGLTGDGNRIPARSIIVYKLKLLKVQP